MNVKNRLPLKCLLCLVLLSSLGKIAAEDIRIVAPYVGSLSNDYTDASSGMNLKDSGLLTGLYFQWINPDKYQWNAFAYYAPDVNYSKILGGHFIFDYYLGANPDGKWVVGAGIESVNMNFDAGDAISGMRDFTMTNRVLVPYGRLGKYFKTDIGPARVSILPWAGVQPEWATSKMEMMYYIPGGPMMGWHSSSTDTSDYFFYGIAGLNLKVNLFHFIDLEGKYQGTFDKTEYLSTWTANANVFFSRKYGLSYRFKYMENDTGSNTYHYIGLAYMF